MSNERPLLREPVSAWTYDPYDAFAPPDVSVGVPETNYLRLLRRDRLTDLYIMISSWHDLGASADGPPYS